jgi:hypothetical protein
MSQVFQPDGAGWLSSMGDYHSDLFFPVRASCSLGGPETNHVRPLWTYVAIIENVQPASARSTSVGKWVSDREVWYEAR